MGDFLISNSTQFLLLGILLGVSAFFSGSETAIFSLSAADLAAFAASNSRLKKNAVKLVNNPRKTLTAILLGNQLVNVAFFAISAQLLIECKSCGLSALAVTAMAAGPLAALVVFGEVCPKNIAITLPRIFAVVSSFPLYLMVRLLGPVQSLFNFVIVPLTRLLLPAGNYSSRLDAAELHQLMELSGRRGLLEPDETRWIREVLHLSNRKISQIMVHRVDMVSFNIADGRDKLQQTFRDTGLAKIPLWRDEPDNIIGLIFARRLLLDKAATLDALLEPVAFIPEQASVEALLRALRQMRSQIAIVVDEYGGLAGLVTMEDAIEEIVGELSTEGEIDSEPIVEVSEGKYLVHGSLALHEWEEVFGYELSRLNDQAIITTAGGAVVTLLERLPRKGDIIELAGMKITVGNVSGGRILTLEVAVSSAKDGGDE